MILTVFQVALGGAVGSGLRFLVVHGALRMGAGPWGTACVNILGSFLMGGLFVVLAQRDALRPLLMTGVLGGFTTFSAFSLDALNLYEKGAPGLAAVYVLVSVGLSIAALGAGVAAMRGVLG